MHILGYTGDISFIKRKAPQNSEYASKKHIPIHESEQFIVASIRDLSIFNIHQGKI